AQPAPQSAFPPPVLPGGASSLPSALLAPSLPPAAVSPAAPNSTPAQPKPNTSNSSPDSTQQKQSQTPKPSPNPSPTKAAVTPLGNFYYVLVNYDSDRTLEQTQAIAPDAYVENFPQGRRIQVGAFKLESEAKTLVEQLQKQGISASVYRP
ncbi:SPOR domain-containing protein, partial [Coleofasciculus sp. LEGE 07081]